MLIDPIRFCIVQSQGKAPVRGKENAKKPSGNKAAQEATEAAQEPAQEKRKSGRASEKKAPKAEKEEAAPPEPAVEVCSATQMGLKCS